MYNMIIVRCFQTSDRVTRTEVALGRMGQYPRVTFRATGFIPAMLDDASTLGDLLEAVAEEMFNLAPHAQDPEESRGLGVLPGFSESSEQLTITGTLDGGGWGGPVRDGQ
jgi:hypothetical protein